MMTIWKYVLPIEDNIEIDMQIGAKILHIDNQQEEVCIWALVNPDEDIETRRFRIYGTGHPVESERDKYIGSAMLRNSSLGFHVFDEGIA